MEEQPNDVEIHIHRTDPTAKWPSFDSQGFDSQESEITFRNVSKPQMYP